MSDKLVNIKNLNDLAKKLDKRNNDNINIINEKINAIEEFVNDAIENIPEGFSGDYNDLINKPEIPTVTNDLTDELKANYDTAYERSESGEMRMYCIDGSSGSLLAAHAPSQDRGNAVFYSTKAYITSSGSIGTNGNINAKAFYEDGTALENKYVTDESLSAVAKSGSYNDLTNIPEIPSIEGLATEELVNNLNNDVVENINEINTELETKASTEFVNNMLSGLRLIQMTQAEYDALQEKDVNTLYIIVN